MVYFFEVVFHYQYKAYSNTFVGGLGDDFMMGRQSQDTYIYNRGDGNDTIENRDGNQNTDKLVFGEGISKEDIHLEVSGDDLVVVITNPNDMSDVSTITLSLAYKYTSYHIAEMHFADGSVITGNWTESLAIKGASNDDTIIGKDASETILGLAGNDIIYGAYGNNLIDGGAGDDQLYIAD